MQEEGPLLEEQGSCGGRGGGCFMINLESPAVPQCRHRHPHWAYSATGRQRDSDMCPPPCRSQIDSGVWTEGTGEPALCPLALALGAARKGKLETRVWSSQPDRLDCEKVLASGTEQSTTPRACLSARVGWGNGACFSPGCGSRPIMHKHTKRLPHPSNARLAALPVHTGVPRACGARRRLAASLSAVIARLLAILWSPK